MKSVFCALLTKNVIYIGISLLNKYTARGTQNKFLEKNEADF